VLCVVQSESLERRVCVLWFVQSESVDLRVCCVQCRVRV